MDPSTKHRRGRASTSCIECKRRKRKCDRLWPCKPCQIRRVAHLCQFGDSHSTKNDKQPLEKEEIGIVNKSLLQYGQGVVNQQPVSDTANALKALGYLESDMFKAVSSPRVHRSILHPPTQVPEEIHQALRAIPPRPYTDSLVQGFFENANHHYGIIHRPSFMESYVEWWSQRHQPQQLPSILNITFTGLVLRMCASSAQFLPPPLRAKLESELGESAESFGTRYQTAAQTLSNFDPPGEGGLVQVQQLFLGATWLKAEAEFIKSWHALAATAREAQEIGMHIDDTSIEMGALEREMRRRLWCCLCAWDSFMSAVFGRPPIVQDRSSVSLPNAGLDEPAADADIPSPALAKVLESQLAMQLPNFGATSTSISDKLVFVESWMASLPRVFNVHDTDTRWDAEHPHLAFQRLQLQCVGYMACLTFLRPYLSSPNSHRVSSPALGCGNEEGAETRRLVTYAIDTALNLMSASNDFFALCFPDQVKHFTVSFCPFDTAALLCSALLHANEQALIPRRLEVIEAIGCALHISNCLVGLTRMGDTTSSILTNLVSRLNLLPEERGVLERARTSGELAILRANVSTGSHSGRRSNVDGDGRVMLETGEPELHHNATADLSTAELVRSDETPGVVDVEGEMWDVASGINGVASEIELGVLDGLWDWGGLGFDSI